MPDTHTNQPETRPANNTSCLTASDTNTAWYPRYSYHKHPAQEVGDISCTGRVWWVDKILGLFGIQCGSQYTEATALVQRSQLICLKECK